MFKIMAFLSKREDIETRAFIDTTNITTCR